MTTREDLINQFLAGTTWHRATRSALSQDASFRRYWRLHQNGQSVLLMDAPPPEKPVLEFAAIADFLRSEGLYAPEIVALDNDNGLMLLEDFGDNTFTRILAVTPHRETELYELAIDALAHLHHVAPPALPDLPPYDMQALLSEAQLLTDWFYPEVTGKPVSDEQQITYMQAWHDSISALPAHRKVLVLRDYHVDNLMELDAEKGVQRCGLLDFQDALLGSPAYDLVSLLEDARRDISPALREHCLQRYFEAMKNIQDFPPPGELAPWLNVLGAQRHAKVLGIFVRLYRRDGKPNYLEHLPRVLALYKDALAREPVLNPVSSWMAENLPFTDIRLRNP